MTQGTRETARETMRKDGSISRLLRRTVGTDTMATELGARMSEGMRAALAEVQARLTADLEGRLAEGTRSLQDALSEEIRRGLAALDERLTQDMQDRFEAMARQLDASVHRVVAAETHRNAAHLDTRLAEVVQGRAEELSTAVEAALRLTVAEEAHRGTAHLDGQMALRIDGAAHRLEAALARSVAEEVQRGAAHLDGQLAHGLHVRADQVSHHLEGALSLAVAEAVHRDVTHMAGDLARQMDTRSGDLHERLREEFHQHLAGQHAQVLEGLAADRAALLAALHSGMSHVDRHLSAHLSKEVALLLGTGGAGGAGGDPRVVQQRVIALGRLLEPCTARGVGRRRFGHAADGGYVMLDDLDGVGFALSFGVGDEMTWDREMAGRGIDVHQFDYTIDAPPETHPRIRFHRSRIAPVAEGTDHSLSSAQALGGDRRCIVKMDIEGDEWVVLDAAGEGDFERVAQFVVEFHDFDKVGNTAWFERAERVLTRLAASFAVVHVHGNNYGALLSRGNVAFPELLEVSFANRLLYEFEPSAERFPTPLDAPNRGDLPDISLGSFRF